MKIFGEATVFAKARQSSPYEAGTADAVLVFSADERLAGTDEGRCRRSIVIRGKIYRNGRNT